MSEQLTAFLDTVAPENREFVSQIDDFLTAECKREVKTAKSGLAVSYVHITTKRAFATYVPRKTGVKLRVYPLNVADVECLLPTLPKA